MKKKEEQLVRKVTDMIQKTREGKLHWDIQCQTTEYNDPAKKPVEQIFRVNAKECIWQQTLCL